MRLLTRAISITRLVHRGEARIHHDQLVSKIHPFANGNGRYARMIADVISVKYGRPEFSWRAGQNLVADGNTRTMYLAALRSLDENENDIQALLELHGRRDCLTFSYPALTKAVVKRGCLSETKTNTFRIDLKREILCRTPSSTHER
jgi:hypothetical protein